MAGLVLRLPVSNARTTGGGCWGLVAGSPAFQTQCTSCTRGAWPGSGVILGRGWGGVGRSWLFITT